MVLIMDRAAKAKYCELDKAKKDFKAFFERNFKRQMTRVEEFIYGRTFQTGWNKGRGYTNNGLKKEIDDLKKEINSLK